MKYNTQMLKWVQTFTIDNFWMIQEWLDSQNYALLKFTWCLKYLPVDCCWDFGGEVDHLEDFFSLTIHSEIRKMDIFIEYFQVEYIIRKYKKYLLEVEN